MWLHTQDGLATTRQHPRAWGFVVNPRDWQTDPQPSIDEVEKGREGEERDKDSKRESTFAQEPVEGTINATRKRVLQGSV
jgi:hypothetical protein